MKKWTSIAVLGIIATSTILAGCGSQQAESPAAGHDHSSQSASPSTKQPVLGEKQVRLQNGDIQEITSSVDQLPTFLDKANQKIKFAYVKAAQNNELLQSMPCYCGCGVSAGHKDNMNCFIKEVKGDGTVVWDDHGTRCDTCMDIAVEASEMKEKGKTVKEIRTYIDNKYKEGYAKPTPTPMPS
ncbi:hypothetical protein OS242_07680 [Tumebacillus sp. DT12]|uniref:Lipoprotein n=1 Tax=Tumebacillus lacus TaxID=2995335 RepID=A0ABT3X2J6_9BACL|nr:PCYCGC motif-containing (lipo)protein [Tumebacillus lacus]MCX7569841.1 hypothetical protein [Tumebacillus lacus]